MTNKPTTKRRNDRGRSQNAKIRQTPTKGKTFTLWAFGVTKIYALIPNPNGGFFAVKPEELL